MLIGLSISAQDSLQISLIDQVDFPTTGNDLWGYVDADGREYIIAGNRQDTRIYTADDTLSLIKTIPGARSVWRDYKVYGDHVYVTADQGNDGVIIIDMSMAPDSISYHHWTDTVYTTLDTTTIQRCHNIWIDTTIGHGYLAGCNNGYGGVITLDLTIDPSAPEIIGVQDREYAHDVFARDGKMYTSEIYGGFLGIYDITTPADPIFLTKFTTSTFFTHNAWLSDDGDYVFTTDEKGGGYVDAYDIRDLDNILRVGSYRPSGSVSVLPHNVHYHDGYLVTSWYTEGVIVLDAARPHNLIKVGQYDTNPQNANGNWGAYPYLPSGRLALTDMDNGLFLTAPSYQRAAYLEGKILDALDDSPINNAQVIILNSEAVTRSSNASGDYATGVARSATYRVEVSQANYLTDTFTVKLENGILTEQDFYLTKKVQHQLSGSISDMDGQPIAGATIQLSSELGVTELQTDSDGLYSVSLLEADYEIVVGSWGFRPKYINTKADGDKAINFTLEAGYEDNFDVDQGWQVGGDAFRGVWERALPARTILGADIANPNTDADKEGLGYAYVTGNDNRDVVYDDVDNGTTTLSSPLIDLSSYSDPGLTLAYWFFNGGGAGEPNDALRIAIITTGDTIDITRITPDSVMSQWLYIEDLPIHDLTDTDQIQLYIETSDFADSGHIVEAGIDAFSISELMTTSDEEIGFDPIQIYPNPTAQWINITGITIKEIENIRITDASGRAYPLSLMDQRLDVSSLSAGVYWISMTLSTGETIVKEIIKSNHGQ